MKFYGRKEELAILQELDGQANHEGIMTVLVGRRRIGKTVLSLEHVKNKKYIYLFVARKNEKLLCEEYIEEIKSQYDYPIFGEIKHFKDVFLALLEIAKKEKITLIIDEFQEFFNINPSVYSDIQKLWDLHAKQTQLHVIFIGSVYSLMNKIFRDKKEPLFGRTNRLIHVSPFSIETLKMILKEHECLSDNSLLDFYALTGGVPKYIDYLLKNGARDQKTILDQIFRKDSLLLNEGRAMLVSEFGKDHATYFSILELIGRGRTSRSEIESVLEKDVGGYLQRLEHDYDVISIHKPINVKPNSRVQKYIIKDNFLVFWFRFIYHQRTAVEIGSFDYLRQIIARDYTTFLGRMLERLYRQLFIESKKYNQIGSYWERGNKNEIDLVAINDLEKTITIAEVKINKEKINLKVLKEKAKKLLMSYPKYEVKYLGLSVVDLY